MFERIDLKQVLDDPRYVALTTKLNHTQAFIMYLKFGFHNNYSYCNDEIAYLMGTNEVEIIKELNEILKILKIDVCYQERCRKAR